MGGYMVNERVIDLMLPRLIPRTTLVERGQLAQDNITLTSVTKKKDAGEEEDNDYESDSD